MRLPCRMSLSRAPGGPLRPFVKLLWLSDDRGKAPRAERERVLPTGTTHVVLRLAGPPLRLFDRVDSLGARELSRAVVGGARSSFYVRDVSQPTRSIGALLHPGASFAVLGVPAGELAGRHTPLAELWGGAAFRLRDRLLECRSEEAQLTLFESFLSARLRPECGLHPVVAHALRRFLDTAEVGAVVKETGYSHRRFLTLFKDAVGLSPKRHCRVLRFHRALDGMGEHGHPLAELAQDAEYSDQAHFARDFREIAGVTPGQFRALAPRHAFHLPVAPSSSVSFQTPPPERRTVSA